MIYSTCSLSIRQNEDIVRDFLLNTPTANLVAIRPDGNVPCDPGSLEGTVRFSPRRNTSGLFIARIRKVTHLWYRRVEDEFSAENHISMLIIRDSLRFYTLKVNIFIASPIVSWLKWLLGEFTLISSASCRMRSRPVSSPTRQILALPRPDVVVTQIDAHMPAGPIQATYEDSTILSPSLGIRKVPDENFPTKHLTKSQSVPVLSKTNTGLRSSILTADLKDTFSTHRSRVHYGSRVALELSNGHLLTIQSPNGRVCISDPKFNERDEVSKMTISPKKQITVFTLVHLTDTQTTAELHFGDPVWLKISSGKGEEGWEHGGVLGVNVRQMPKLKLAASRHSTSAMVVGTPSPLAAYVPKVR